MKRSTRLANLGLDSWREIGWPVTRSKILMYLSSCPVTRMGIVGCDVMQLIWVAGVPSVRNSVQPPAITWHIVENTRTITDVAVQFGNLFPGLNVENLHDRVLVCDRNLLEVRLDGLNCRCSRRTGIFMKIIRVLDDAVPTPRQLQGATTWRTAHVPHLHNPLCSTADKGVLVSHQREVPNRIGVSDELASWPCLVVWRIGCVRRARQCPDTNWEVQRGGVKQVFGGGVNQASDSCRVTP